MGEFAIGQGVSRFEDPRLVRGAGHYTDDVQIPGMTYGVVLRSGHAHAKINAINTAAAKATPGVLAIITGANWKAAGLGDLPSHSGLKRPGGGAMFKPRYTVLAEDRVRWVGDPVAFVVAETLTQAMDAAEMIQVDYEELPAVTSTADATKPGSARVYDDCPDNISFMEPIGDKAACDAGFAKAAHVVKHRFVVNRVTAVTMEPRGAVARFDRGDGRYVIHTPTQRPHGFRGVERLRLCLRDNEGNRIAHPAHAVLRQHRVARLVHRSAAGPLEAAVRGQVTETGRLPVGGGDDGEHAGRGFCG